MDLQKKLTKMANSSSEVRPPSLFTLERARQRAEIYRGVQQSVSPRSLDDPYLPVKRTVQDAIVTPGSVHHTQPFDNFYSNQRLLSPAYAPSIVYCMEGALDVNMFSKKVKSKNQKADDSSASEHSENKAMRAFKCQQASVDRLFYHQGDPGKRNLNCACVHGQRRHFKLKKRFKANSSK